VCSKTKIICTLGPASWDPEVIGQLIEAGVDAARINFSHGDRDSHLRMYRTFREVAAKLGKQLPVMGDLQGPRIRVGEIPGSGIRLEQGGRIVLSSRNEPARDKWIGTTYKSLSKDLSPGNTVLLNDGLLRLTVEKIDGDDVHCRVEVGGRLSSHKGINLPEISISGPPLTDKDRADLEFMIKEGFDFVALSFVQSAGDVKQLKEILSQAGSNAQVVAKIEKPTALEDLGPVLEQADGVIVARGDLGVELGVERVPAQQKRILRTAAKKNVLSITATQLLESMVHNPVPTRAEASDVANAVFDGTDALLFTGETAAGKYPVETVATADRIVREAETSVDTWGDPALLRHDGSETFTEAICHAAVSAALDLEASAIVVGTQSGLTALLLSKFRPPMPVVGVSDNEIAVRRMNLMRGVYPVQLPRMNSLEESVALAREHLLKAGIGSPGDSVVMTFGAPLSGRGRTNTLRMVEL
jgi:pyruvate kinase